jgi:astacin (peptidase family M12A)
VTSRPKVCTDRVLPANRMLFQDTYRRSGVTFAVMPLGKLWMNGSTLRVRFIGGTQAQRDKAITQASWWMQSANLRFIFGDAPDAEIRVAFSPNDGAWSYVGTDNAGIPFDQPTMNLGFLDGGTAAHEFGHAIGLAHEHQNPASGIEWNEEVVLRDLAGPPNFWTSETIRHNVLNKYGVNQVRGTAFDPDSIMLYWFPAGWVKSGVGTKANNVLSATDKSYIGSSLAYPKATPIVNDAAEIKVNAPKRTIAAIGKFGEEDLFRFGVTVGGLHTIDTQGPTDVVMKLFGPNSQTSLLGEDDDSGLSTNALIRANLIPGVYYVQVRHYNRTRGVGSYSVKVQR